MLKVENLSFSFPQKDLFQNISFTIENDRHCAFIGTNGTGKSTLIDLIRNPENYMFDGKLELDSPCRIGYVSQFATFNQENEQTVYEFLSGEYLSLQQQLATICSEMETASELDLLLEQYQQTLDAIDAIGGDDFESTITKKLNLANLNKHADLPVSKLSGGEFKLLQVIKEMLTAPDLMIMDEPDVFLDFEHLNSLKDLINSHKGSMLVITHNRYLLAHCFDKIIHLENKELQEFDGNYANYNFTLLQTKIELQELAAADEEEIERNRKIVDKLRAEATYYTCASRGRALNARVSIIERLEARKIKAPFVELKQPDIHFSTNNCLEEGSVALSVNDYHLAFQEKLLEEVSFEIKATDKVALIGANGTGKTTLLRDLYHHTKDTICLSEGIEVAMLSQLQGEMLYESHTIEEEFFDAGFTSYDEISSYLSRYGFEEEHLKQTIGALSGGEKNLLQIAKIAAGNANLLLLDEPTSHLDTYSQLALEQAIKNYNGAVLMISHDFYTIANCMDYVLLIEGKTIRKVSIRKFRKMIYANHFSKEYLEIEQKTQALETKIIAALRRSDYPLAKTLSEELEPLIKLL